jgi:probable phosphoglycerate mutase
VPSIHLIRHGETALNVQRRLQGSTDEPLAPNGIRQVEALRIRLSETLSHARIVTSPLLRARETAELLSGSRAAVDSRFSERSFGPFEGMFLEEVRKEKMRRGLPVHDIASGWGATEAVEPAAVVAERMLAGLAEQVDDMADDDCVLIVSHAAALRILCYQFWGLHESAPTVFSLRPASYMRLWIEPAWSGANLLELWMNPLAHPSWLPPTKGLVTTS